MRAFKKISADGLDLLGIYHSHVASDPQPSQTDRTMAFYPDVSYLIVSLSNMDQPHLMSFKIVGDDVTTEELRIS